jgi:Uma2 family endonuclease
MRSINIIWSAQGKEREGLRTRRCSVVKETRRPRFVRICEDLDEYISIRLKKETCPACAAVSRVIGFTGQPC